MVRPNPRVRFTVDDYMSTPEGTRYQLLDGEMILAPSPTGRHQKILLELSIVLHPFITGGALGDLWTSPFDVVFEGQDVAQPDILFVSSDRADIVTPENVQGAPDLCVEVTSPSTAQYDRGYKLALYGRHGVREYWIVDPAMDTVEIYIQSPAGLVLEASYSRGDSLTSPLLEGLAIDLERIFSVR